MALFRVDKREDASDGLLGYDWIEVLAIEHSATAFRTRTYGDWCDRLIVVDYVCLTPYGLTKIRSDDFWTALEEYREYDEQTPQVESGIVITTGDASVVQTGGTMYGGVQPSTSHYAADSVGAMGPSSTGSLVDVDFVSADLVNDLERIRVSRLGSAGDVPDLRSLAALAQAEASARDGDERAVRTALSQAGRRALEIAREIGASVAAAAIARAIGAS